MSKWATFSAILTSLATPVLAGATLYLAYSAKNSADSAKTAATTATATAETAKDSINIIRRWFELSQRPFVNLGQWQIILDRQEMAVQGRLYDVAHVPTDIEKVCVWTGTAQTVDSQRTYAEIALAENAMAFRDHYQLITYGVFQRRDDAPAGTSIAYLSTIYTLSTESTSFRETWRVDTEILMVLREGRRSREFMPIDMYRVDSTPC